MATETSAVFVAVRVRPLNARESPLECTVTVLDDRTMTLTDLSSHTVGSSSSSVSAQQHVFTFDKIFWSIPPNVLPMSAAGLTPPTRSPRMSCVEGMALSTTFRSTSIAASGPPSSWSRSNSLFSTLQDTSSVTTSRIPFNGLPCFAHVPEYDDQASVYNFIGPRMHESIMTGFNSCLFAYGQTGSGKTHSLLGPPDTNSLRSEERGIVPRLCEDLFELMRKDREEDESVTYNVECSFLEIYCERVHDLLSHSSSGGSISWSKDVSVGGSGASASSLQPSPSSPSAQPSLRVRQHPTRGPFVEGLTLMKVRDANAVMKQITHGMRERATAETRMNEHSSRSHAMMQLYITRVAVVQDEAAVVTKTRVCKLSMVDLAGSERVTQSGAAGDRFEEARNINLSLTTLGRVILQLSEKQSGKHVIPAYRDSVLTWLLSDSLGGNSKTIMLATIAPSAYCYQQSLNTLRFAGVTKKVINVASINEDQHFQKLIASLRQQIVKLTLQLEEGKASEVHSEEIRVLRLERDELRAELDVMRTAMLTMVSETEVAALQRRVADLEEANAQIHTEKNQVQRQLVSTTTALREELVQKRGEIMKLHEALLHKDGEVQGWIRRYREEVVMRETSPLQPQQDGCNNKGKVEFDPRYMAFANWQLEDKAKGLKPPPPLVIAGRSNRQEEEIQSRISALMNELKTERLRAEEAEKARKNLQGKIRALQGEQEAAARLLEETQQRLAEKVHVLDETQSELAATQKMLRLERGAKSTAEREKELVAQLESIRVEYLSEKKKNVDLLMRVSKVDQQMSKTKKDAASKARDINELEQLFLEETETSERYYIRLCYYRELFTIAMPYVRRSLNMQRKHIATVNNSISNYNNGNHSDDVVLFMREHAVCECVRNEAYSRVLLEEESLNGLLELLGQKTILYDLAAAAAKSDALELRALAAEAAEEHERLRRRVGPLELAIAKASEERVKMQTELQRSESTRERLARQVESLTAEVEQLQQRNNALIEKVVEAQSTNDAMDNPRGDVCGRSNSRTVAWVGDDDGDGMQKTEKAEEQQKQKSHVLRLEKQVEQYQEELGLLHAQLEKERNEKVEKLRLMQREKDECMQEVKRVRSDCKASIMESTEILKDYEKRIRELEETIATLQSALEEECNNADKARDGMLRAESVKRETLQELRRMEASREALSLSREDLERRFDLLRDHVQELQASYYELEKQLASMSLHVADVYLTIDRSNGDGENSWMEKAKREKEVLEQQKQSVKRLNEELLATVRKRNESLRAVHRQITKMQSGGISPDVTEEQSEKDNSPLAAQLRRSPFASDP